MGLRPLRRLDHPPHDLDRERPMTTLRLLTAAVRHLWQCSHCGAWSDTPTVNGKCTACL